MPCTMSALLDLLSRLLSLLVCPSFTQLHIPGHSQFLEGRFMWAGEGGLGMALLAWLTAVSPAINMDGCDLLRH